MYLPSAGFAARVKSVIGGGKRERLTLASDPTSEPASEPMLETDSDFASCTPATASASSSTTLCLGGSGALGASSCLGGCGLGASGALRKMSAAVGATGFTGAGAGAGTSAAFGATGSGAGAGAGGAAGLAAIAAKLIGGGTAGADAHWTAMGGNHCGAGGCGNGGRRRRLPGRSFIVRMQD